MKLLGIDYGEKRIGLSCGDELGLASPLPAAVEPAKAHRLDHIGRVIRERGITELVIGHPLNMDGTSGFKAKEVEKFVTTLTERFGLPVHLVDERLTSYDVETQLKEKKKKVSRSSGVVDSLAATLILQDFLDRRFPPLMPDPDAGGDEDEYDEDEYDDD